MSKTATMILIEEGYLNQTEEKELYAIGHGLELTEKGKKELKIGRNSKTNNKSKEDK